MGFQIALTGCVLCVMMVAIAAIDGRPSSLVSKWKMVPVMVTCFASAGAIIAGTLMGIWGY